jgi:hypothetical protein
VNYPSPFLWLGHSWRMAQIGLLLNLNGRQMGDRLFMELQIRLLLIV